MIQQQACEAVCPVDPIDAWLEARKTGVGASEVPAILGISEYASALDVYANKLALVEDSTDSAALKEAAEWGLDFEPVIGRRLAKRRGMEFTHNATLMRSTRWPWMLATKDGDLSGRVCQIKTTNVYREERWEGGIPLDVVAQVQAEMLVNGVEHATVACLIGGQKLIWDDVEFNPELGAVIVEATEQFWKCVQERRPPTDARPLLRSVKAVWKDANRDRPPITLTHDTERAMLKFERVKAIIRKLDKRKEELEAVVRAEMQDAATAIMPGGGVVTLHTTERAGYVVQPSSFRVLRYSKAKK